MNIDLSAADVAALAAGTALPLTLVPPAQAAVPTPAPVPVPPSPPTTTALAARIVGGKLVDGAGKPLQLRGVNVSGLESVAIQGWAPGDPWGGQKPNLAAIKAWGANAVRLPLNEASWLGLTTYDYSGKTRKADPGGNYQATVIQQVKDATAAGLYVIIDDHWSAPNLHVSGQQFPVPFSPMGQAPMADADHSPAFWTSVAETFKDYPNVIFDLFNEPYPDMYGPVSSPWEVWRDGGQMAQFPNNTSGGANFNMVQPWQTAGMQALLNAVRGAGASNIVMCGGLSYAQDMSQWLTYAPKDPMGQLAASVHLYPQWQSTPGTPTYDVPNAARLADCAAIVGAGYPLVVGELGGHVAGTGDAFTAACLKAIDAMGASVCAWTWNAWGNPDNVLIKDSGGTPTSGIGATYKAYLAAH